MPDLAPRYTIEPYIGNGRPQWRLHRMVPLQYTNFKGEIVVEMVRHYIPECIVDTEAEARALIAHMDRASDAP